jgi:hypothetical protein
MGCMVILIREFDHTILKLANHALFKMVRYVLLRPLRPEQNRPARRTGPTDRTPILYI